MKNWEQPRTFNKEISRISGEEIKLERAVCECGHVLSFIRPHAQICKHCGRLVYPNKRIEFKDKMMRKLRIK